MIGYEFAVARASCAAHAGSLVAGYVGRLGARTMNARLLATAPTWRALRAPWRPLTVNQVDLAGLTSMLDRTEGRPPSDETGIDRSGRTGARTPEALTGRSPSALADALPRRSSVPLDGARLATRLGSAQGASRLSDRSRVVEAHHPRPSVEPLALRSGAATEPSVVRGPHSSAAAKLVDRDPGLVRDLDRRLVIGSSLSGGRAISPAERQSHPLTGRKFQGEPTPSRRSGSSHPSSATIAGGPRDSSPAASSSGESILGAWTTVGDERDGDSGSRRSAPGGLAELVQGWHQPVLSADLGGSGTMSAWMTAPDLDNAADGDVDDDLPFARIEQLAQLFDALLQREAVQHGLDGCWQ